MFMEFTEKYLKNEFLCLIKAELLLGVLVG